MVAVPEVDDDPANFALSIAAAGYFEGLYVTDEDRQRTVQYRGNAKRDALDRSQQPMLPVSRTNSIYGSCGIISKC